MATTNHELVEVKNTFKVAARMRGRSRMFRLWRVRRLNATASATPVNGRGWLGALIALLFLLAPRAVSAQGSASAAQTSDQQLMARNGNSSKDIQKVIPNDPKYAIGPEDVLNVSVWKEPDITQTVVVRPDGRISLPLVNDLQAAGLTPTQLAAEVTAELRRYLADPRVTVVVTQINSQRIYVLGEVNKPGAYALFPGMTFLQALSSAGGFTQFADSKKIYLLRTDNDRQAKFPFNYKEVARGRAPEQNVTLKTGDTIIVP